MQSNRIIRLTKKWIKSFIIEYNICPFAQRPFLQDKIHYAVINCDSMDTCLLSVYTECQRLDKHPEIETSFLIYSNTFQQFDDFLDFLFLSEELLKTYHYEGVYQLASFHPQYCFATGDILSPENYTNKSPYPMLHLIREKSITKAIQNFTCPERIPQNNIEITRKLGAKQLHNMLRKIMNE